jgi:hypothetical protein
MKTLFITQKDIKRYSVLSGNVDPGKFLQYVEIAQNIHIESYLGTRLYERLQDDIINDTLAGDYLKLLNDYVKPMTIHWAMVEYLPFAAYTVANNGVYKRSAENSETVDKGEVDFLTQKHRNTADNYTRRFVDFICFNLSKFPEYNQNQNEDLYPRRDSNFAGWNI